MRATQHTMGLNCMIDGDGAGLKAAERLLPMAIRAGINVKIVIFPEGHDPESHFCEDFQSRFQTLQ
jgi:DNA primase